MRHRLAGEIVEVGGRRRKKGLTVFFGGRFGRGLVFGGVALARGPKDEGRPRAAWRGSAKRDRT
jgi:hypothetical protein